VATRDLVHRFYQEQYQWDGGRQDRYVTGSDAVRLTMGVYDTTQLPIWQYRTAPAPRARPLLAERRFARRVPRGVRAQTIAVGVQRANRG